MYHRLCAGGELCGLLNTVLDHLWGLRLPILTPTTMLWPGFPSGCLQFPPLLQDGSTRRHRVR